MNKYLVLGFVAMFSARALAEDLRNDWQDSSIAADATTFQCGADHEGNERHGSTIILNHDFEGLKAEFMSPVNCEQSIAELLRQAGLDHGLVKLSKHTQIVRVHNSVFKDDTLGSLVCKTDEMTLVDLEITNFNPSVFNRNYLLLHAMRVVFVGEVPGRCASESPAVQD